jgi:signal peptidase S26 family
MPDAISRYLDLVMFHAALAPPDERCVRGELADHLHELAARCGAAPQTEKEMLAMFSKEFGDPKEVGSSIARSKGRFRTYLKKKMRRLAVAAAVLVMLSFAVRATVAEVYFVPGDSVSPILIKGSRCLVYKLAGNYAPGDVIVYKPAENRTLRFLGIVKEIDAATGDLHVTRNGRVELTVPHDDIVGRVVANTR